MHPFRYELREKRMRILFVVCGEGLGHSSRSTKLARYLQNQGHTCYFAAYDKGYDFIKSQGFDVIETPREVTLEGTGGCFDLKKTVKSSAGIPVALGQSFFQIHKFIREKDIEFLIADTMFACGVAAKSHKRLPVLFITNQNKFGSAVTSGKDVYVWKTMSKVISTYHRYVPDLIAVPDFAEPYMISGYNFDPEDKARDKYIPVGPILDDRINDYTPTKETVFASFGGEPYKQPMYQMLRNIADIMPEEKFEIFSTSPGMPQNTANFTATGYVPNLFEPMARAKVAIIHGGLTSLHEAIFYRKPVILIIDPYHPEQWNNGRKVEELGLGIMLRSDEITEEKLHLAISNALTMQPPDMRKLFEEYDGCKGCAQLIEHVYEKHRKP
ncbi:MAG TPA: glycosyltransferase [Methanocorpusculum sp.]|nr:glycosyltransferase [Methanocorpusculum sp.]